MDGSVAIETNRAALVRIVATLAAMAGLARASHLPLEGRSASGDAAAETDRRVGSQRPRSDALPPQEVSHGRNDPTRFVPLRGPQRPPLMGEVTRAPTITRHLWRTILRLLRPSEAAARRLIIAAARGIVPPPPRFTRSPSPASQGRISSGAAGTTLILPRLRGRGTAEGGGGGILIRPIRPIALPLFDPLRRPFRPLHRVPERAAPRISVPGWTVRRPVPPPSPPPSPDDLVSAARMRQRIAALAAALDDLPRQVRRFARLKARLDARNAWDEPSASQAGHARRRFRRISPLRGGAPYGGRLAVWDPSVPRGKNIREIDVVLAHAHALALYALEFPDTS